MNGLISADIRRILRKPTYWILLAAVALLCAAVALHARSSDHWGAIAFLSGQETILSFTFLFVQVSILLAVFADEFSSNAMQCLIGRGISRFRLLLARVLECIMVTLTCMLLLFLVEALLALALGAGLTAEGWRLLGTIFFTSALQIIGEAAITMMILYATGRVPVAVIVNIALPFIFEGLEKLLNRIPGLKFLHPENKLFPKALELSGVDLMLGRPAVLSMLLRTFGLCAVCLLLTWLLFRKKELEF